MTDAVELARTLVRAETVNPPGNEAAAARIVAARLDAAGCEVVTQEVAPGRENVVARLRGRSDRPAICFTGHLDVVPVGDAEWTHEPFAGELDGDRLYGRGASDMKGGVAAIVVAVEQLATGWTGAGAGIEVVLTCGEETGCEGAKALASSGLLGEVGAMIVAEPTSNQPRIAHKGVLWLRAETEGTLAHGAAPELGENAIYPLAEAVARLSDFTFDIPSHPLLGEPTLSVGTFHSGANVNSVPDRAVAEIDVRTVPGFDRDAFVDVLAQHLGPAVTLTPLLELPAVETEPSDPWVVDVLDVLEAACGERPEPAGMRPFTDAAVLAPAYGDPPTIVCGPGESDQAHRTDEWCSTVRIEQAVDAYVDIARRRSVA